MEQTLQDSPLPRCLLVQVVHWLSEVDCERGVVVEEEADDEILRYHCCLEVPNWPQPDKDKI